MILNRENLFDILEDCLGDYGDDDLVKVEGVVTTFYFNKKKIEDYKEDIKSLLMRFPSEFSEGSGWSFLNAATLNSGEQWGEQKHVEQLMCLGIAAGYVIYLFPREMWKILPGGVPYFTVKFGED